MDVVEGRYGVGRLVMSVTRPKARGQFSEANPVACKNPHSSLSGAAVFDVGGEGVRYETMPSFGLGELEEARGFLSNCVYFLNQQDVDCLECAGGEEEFEAPRSVYIN